MDELRCRIGSQYRRGEFHWCCCFVSIDNRFGLEIAVRRVEEKSAVTMG